MKYSGLLVDVRITSHCSFPQASWLELAGRSKLGLANWTKQVDSS
jgi:hypothetical protein